MSLNIIHLTELFDKKITQFNRARGLPSHGNNPAYTTAINGTLYIIKEIFSQDEAERFVDRIKASKEAVEAAYPKLDNTSMYFGRHLDICIGEIENYKERLLIEETKNGSGISFSALFINNNRIKELRNIEQTKFSTKKLIKYCEEINICFATNCFLSLIMLIRAIMDHVPPIFQCKNFSEVANNYKGAKSFKQSMQHLNNSARKIADLCLHEQIRSSEMLPNETQINFSNDLDLMLAEIVRILSKR